MANDMTVDMVLSLMRDKGYEAVGLIMIHPNGDEVVCWNPSAISRERQIEILERDIRGEFFKEVLRNWILQVLDKPKECADIPCGG